jgi:ribosomal protein L7/L12
MQFTCAYCHVVLGITRLVPEASGVPVVRLHGVGYGKILTIKAVRELTGLGLREAVEIVEGRLPVDLRATRAGAQVTMALADLQAAGAQYELLGGERPTPRQAPPPGASTETSGPGVPGTLHVMLAHSGQNKIAVIKVIREVTGLGLKESKDLCDRTPCHFAVRPDYNEAKVLRLFAEAGAAARIER